MSGITGLIFWSMKFIAITTPVSFLFEVFFPLSAYFVDNMQKDIVLEQSIKIEMLQKELLDTRQELLVAKGERAVRQEIIANCISKPVNIDYTSQMSRAMQMAVSKELNRYFSKENEDIFNDRITYLAKEVVELGDMFYRLQDAVWEYSDDSQDFDATDMIATELNCPRQHVWGEYLMQSSDNYSTSVINFGIDKLFQNVDIISETFIEEKAYMNKKLEEGIWLYEQGPLVASMGGDDIKSITKITPKIEK